MKESLGIIAVCAAVTFLTRSLPFFFESVSQPSGFLKRYSAKLPYALIAFLAVFSLKGYFSSWATAVAACLSAVLTALAYKYSKSFLACIICGTFSYIIALAVLAP